MVELTSELLGSGDQVTSKQGKSRLKHNSGTSMSTNRLGACEAPANWAETVAELEFSTQLTQCQWPVLLIAGA